MEHGFRLTERETEIDGEISLDGWKVDLDGWNDVFR